MVPAANTVGFCGSELARKLPKVLGVIVETTLGSVVELVLFMVLLVTGRESNVPVIRAAALGSILANMLLCLGFCFVAGGLKGGEQSFHEAISEAGSGLMLVAASTSSRTIIVQLVADLHCSGPGSSDCLLQRLEWPDRPQSRRQ